MFCCFSGPAEGPTKGQQQAAVPAAPAASPVTAEGAVLQAAPAAAPKSTATAADTTAERSSRSAVAPSPASASNPALPAELAQILRAVPAAGTKSNDVWGNLQKCADCLSVTIPVTCVSLYIFTSSRRYFKLIANSTSPQFAQHRKGGWELSHAAEAPTAHQVVSSGTPLVVQAPEHAMPSNSGTSGGMFRKLPADYHLLLQEAGCTSFICIPVYQGHTIVGAMLLAHKGHLPAPVEHRWLAPFLSLLSVYLQESSAMKLANFSERLQSANSLNQLAWLITSELDTWFDWSHPDDTEARLVLMSPDQATAMVLSRSVGPMRTYDPLNSIDVLVSGAHRPGSGVLQSASQRRRSASTISVREDAATNVSYRRDSGTSCMAPASTRLSGTPTVKQAEEGLLGTHMSLANTLTRRCLAEGSKLLFVADVMAALKKYGEPWKDIFMEAALVTNPSWVVAAPIVHQGKHLGAILWLSSSRLNPNMMAQAAKATVPPLLHTVARQIQHLVQQQAAATNLQSGHVSGNSNTTLSGGLSVATAPTEDPAAMWAQVLALPHLTAISGTTGDARNALGLSRNTFYSRSNSQDLPVGALTGASTATGMVGSGVLDSEGGNRPLRYTVMVRSDSASTSALMRAYQQAILQHQRAGPPSARDDMSQGYEEIQVLAKAGQGAFGSVYVALWKGLVVAVKVMRQQSDGRRAMRTAWELAVTKSVSHPNIVMVHATFTDVVVVKLSKRIIRFVPAATVLAEPTLGAASQPAGGSGSGGGLGSNGAMPPPSPAAAAGSAAAAQQQPAAGAGQQQGAPPSGGATAGTSDAAGAAASADNMNSSRCQVIIMEYCNLGPLHHYVAERKQARAMALAGNGPPGSGGSQTGGMPGAAWAAAAPATGPAATAAAAGRADDGTVISSTDNPNQVVVPNNNSSANSAVGAGLCSPTGAGAAVAAAATAAAPFSPAGGGAPPPPLQHAHSGPPLAAAGAAAGAAASANSISAGLHTSHSITSSNQPVVDFAVTLATLIEVAGAVQYLHTLGFIHCDLKPENILLKSHSAQGDPRGFTAKVSDFGLSELFTSDGPLMGELGGTVTHIAPEIVTHKRVTKAADVYAFGVVMWELYTGHRPYTEMFNSGREKRVRDKLILARVAHEGLRPIFPESTPYEYALLARRCWVADPSLRPTFAEVIGELEALQRRFCKPPAASPLGGNSRAPSPLPQAQPQAAGQHAATDSAAGAAPPPVAGARVASAADVGATYAASRFCPGSSGTGNPHQPAHLLASAAGSPSPAAAMAAAQHQQQGGDLLRSADASTPTFERGSNGPVTANIRPERRTAFVPMPPLPQ